MIYFSQNWRWTSWTKAIFQYFSKAKTVFLFLGRRLFVVGDSGIPPGFIGKGELGLPSIQATTELSK